MKHVGWYLLHLTVSHRLARKRWNISSSHYHVLDFTLYCSSSGGRQADYIIG